MPDKAPVAFILRTNQISKSFHIAQKDAIEYKRPLVTIYIINPTNTDLKNELKKLLNIENHLKKLGITLIVLIDTSKTKLEIAINSLNPYKIYFEDLKYIVSTLTNHPYNWSGKVLSISELLNLDVKELCLD